MTGNSTGSGGGVYARLDNGGLLTVNNTSFTYNIASTKGGGLYVLVNDGATTITDSLFDDNTSGGDGGGLYIHNTDGTATLSSSIFTANETLDSDGGGAYLSSVGASAVTTISRSTFDNNTAERTGSGLQIRVDGGASQPSIAVPSRIIVRSGLQSMVVAWHCKY